MARSVITSTLLHLWISSITALEADISTAFQPLDYCAWSPLQVPELLSCTPSIRDEVLLQQSLLHTHSHSSSPWQGPHACAKSFCVYSNPTFAGGRGMVIITTTQNANSISRLPIFAEDTDLESRKQSNTSHESPSTSSSTNDPPFRIAQVPGKGLGVIATRHIARGQQIMAHPPVLIGHGGILDSLDKDEQARLLDAAVAQLPPPTRELFMAQMGHAGGPSKAVDITMTNSFGMALPIVGGNHYFGVFPEVSRYNHDCRPNVQFYIEQEDDNGLLTHHTHAVKDIQPGEELTLTYVDPFRARAVRQDRTQRSWGFKCSCAQCSLPEPLAKLSDDRLWRIYEVENKIGDWNSTINTGTIELLLSLYKQERLDQSHASDALVHAALNYNAFGEEDLATKYALLALEAGMLEKGPNSRHVQAMKLLLKSPREHWSWQQRLTDD